MGRAVWIAAMIAAMAMAAPGAAMTEDVECGSLKHLRIADLDQYDFTSCARDTHRSRVTDGYAESKLEILVAQSRATFVVLRYEEAGRYTYFPVRSVADTVSEMLAVRCATGARSGSMGDSW